MNTLEQQLLIIAVTWAVCMLIIGYGLYRNNCVLKYRLRIIDESMVKYRRLPSYEYMNDIKWWVWDFDSFLDKG